MRCGRSRWYALSKMTYWGKVKGGAVILDRGIELPEGADVRVEIKTAVETESGRPDPLARMSELAVETEISDLATNVDHYLYGHPKADAG